MAKLDEKILELLAKGKKVDRILASLDDNSIWFCEAAFKLLDAHADPNEMIRVTTPDTCWDMGTFYLERGADADFLLRKMFGKGACSFRCRGVNFIITEAINHGASTETVMGLIEDDPDLGQQILRELWGFPDEWCRELDIDRCFKAGVKIGMFGEDILNVFSTGCPHEKIVRQCAAEEGVEFKTVTTLADRGIDVSEIAEAHPELVVEYPRWFKPKESEKLYKCLHPRADIDTLMSEFGFEPRRVIDGILQYQGDTAGRYYVAWHLESFLRNGLAPSEYADKVMLNDYCLPWEYGPDGVVQNFRLLKQYDPEFDLKPSLSYYLSDEKDLRELLDCKANRKAVVKSVVTAAHSDYPARLSLLCHRDGCVSSHSPYGIVKLMLEEATSEELRLLLNELPADIVAHYISCFLACDELGADEIHFALDIALKNGQLSAILGALPSLHRRGVPIERSFLEKLYTRQCTFELIGTSDAEGLVAYGFSLTELVNHMYSWAVLDSIEALIEEGHSPDWVAAKFLERGGEIDKDTRKRLKAVGAKLWV